MDIRQELRMRRFSLNIKVKEIAEFLGCSVGLISNWEHDRSYMGKDKVEMYKEYLDSYEGREEK
ncbi:helix-turn-helix domain-containing protein [Paenibacillus dokdonensis]|uniref:helix-turn-helix domain-containing protein n=1 Tax=Paenibacillus dokdonensis TaxID=2567944 RepID=UPI0010A8D929|nr:helix-turn-helix transcriptional regulator [Paenibacillus dokdonensis]